MSLLHWTQRIAAIAQTGLEYSRDPYDRERFEQLQAIAAQMAAAASGQQVHEILAAFRVEEGYATPKVDIRAVVFDDQGRILLARERSDGLWSVPGGWADVGQSPAEVAVREVLEETGYEVRATRVAAVYHRAKHPHSPLYWDVYKLFMVCDLVGGSARESLETSEARFFARHEIPPLSVSRVTPEQLERMFDMHDEPSRPTEFD